MCADESLCGFCSNYSSTANAVPPLPLESVKGSLRSLRAINDRPYGGGWILCEEGVFRDAEGVVPYGWNQFRAQRGVFAELGITPHPSLNFV